MAIRNSSNTGNHSLAGDAHAMADWSAHLSEHPDPAAKSLKGSLDARLEVVKVLSPGDPEIAALIGQSENVYRGLNPFAHLTLERAKAMLRGEAVSEFKGGVDDVELGEVNLDPSSSANDKSFGHLLHNILQAGGIALPPEVSAHYPSAQMSAEDLGLNMDEVM